MQIYLVGGAVRDELLGLEVKDRDWVVVGSSPEEMLQKGFTPVGRDFPVFLHPQTHEEYALARTERKSAPGYHGFTFHASPEVTLLEDLARRDLTINAMAKTANGELIDPFGGAQDLQNKIFRHVSPAFEEDPVRVLRLARFAARFAEFSIAKETLQLAQSMVLKGEIQALVPERVWGEVSKALMLSQPARFFEVLMVGGAFALLFPQLAHLQDLPMHSSPFFQSLNTSAQHASALESRFGLCFYPYQAHDLNRSKAQALCDALKVSSPSKDMAQLVVQLGEALSERLSLDAQHTLDLIESLDGFRRPNRLEQALSVFDMAAQCAQHERMHMLASHVAKALETLRQLDAKALTEAALAQGLQGVQVGAYLHAQRHQALERAS